MRNIQITAYKFYVKVNAFAPLKLEKEGNNASVYLHTHAHTFVLDH